jgi:hypothetical protein
MSNKPIHEEDCDFIFEEFTKRNYDTGDGLTILISCTAKALVMRSSPASIEKNTQAVIEAIQLSVPMYTEMFLGEKEHET